LRGFLAAALVLVAAVGLEVVLPGRDVYHAGWYNVLLSALVVVAIAASRREFRKARTLRVRLAVVAVAFGAGVSGFAGVASGLLAPDNRTVIGAPGERVRLDELDGALTFPLASAGSTNAAPVVLERPHRAPMTIGARWSDAGSFILHTTLRDVVYVEARDSQGGRLTVTQPAGTAFLSPVLLMEQRQMLVGMNLPYDSFNVPAARRVVKVILFSPAEAAMLLHGAGGIGEPVVLFAVDDENDRLLPHAIALGRSGRAVRAGGLLLRATVTTYPAVEVVAAPTLVVVAIGTLIVLAGVVTLLTGHDRPNVSQDDAALRELDTPGWEHVNGDQSRGHVVGGKADDDVSPAGLVERRRVE
jgi:hypothetical protein